MLAQQQKLRQYKPLKKILPHAYLFSENKKYGIVDSKGKLIVEAKYDSIHPFYHNRAAVDSANFQGVIDEVGREIIAPKYYSDIWGFEDSTYSVVFLNFETGFGYIDRDGKKVFPYILNRANYFQGGLAWVGSSKFKKGPLEEYYTGYYYNPNKNRTNFLDRNFQLLIPEVYDTIAPYKREIPRVAGKNGKLGILSKIDAKVIVPLKYKDLIPSPHQAVVWAAIDKKWGLIDTNHRILTKFKYDKITPFHERYGVAVVAMGDKKGLIGNTGKELTPIIYDDALEMNDGRALVKQNDKYGYVDWQGKLAIPLAYRRASSFQQGRALVYEGLYRKVIDKHNKILSEKIDPFCTSIFWVSLLVIILIYYIFKK